MAGLRRMMSSAMIWGLVLAAGVALAAIGRWSPTLLRMAASGGDDRPGARRAPTAEEVRGAQEMWKKRRAEGD